MIFGLVAAVGWGLSDFWGAVASRRIGSLWVVLIAQGFAAVVAAAILLAYGESVAAIWGAAGLLALNGVFSATAYVTHYRALELGPVAVVSPVGATYALFGSILAVIFLNERPGTLTLVAAIVTVLGVMLTSTDLPKLRAGIHGMPPGLPWAIVSAVCFGVGAFTLAKLSRDLGWQAGLFGSRLVQIAAFSVVALARRRELRGNVPPRSGIAFAVAVGAADLVGVVFYAIGAGRGFVTVVLVASAVFPLIAVGLSIAFLDERPAINQYVGVALTVTGLVALGLA